MLSAIVIEIVLTAGFLLVIHGATDKYAPAGFCAYRHWSGTDAYSPDLHSGDQHSVNPARSTAVAIFGGGWAILEQLWLFWVMPIVGGILGGVLYRTLLENAINLFLLSLWEGQVKVTGRVAGAAATRLSLPLY